MGATGKCPDESEGCSLFAKKRGSKDGGYKRDGTRTFSRIKVK